MECVHRNWKSTCNTMPPLFVPVNSLNSIIKISFQHYVFLSFLENSIHVLNKTHQSFITYLITESQLPQSLNINLQNIITARCQPALKPPPQTLGAIRNIIRVYLPYIMAYLTRSCPCLMLKSLLSSLCTIT